MDCYGRRSASFVRVSLWLRNLTSSASWFDLSGYGRIEVQPQQYPQWMCTLMHWVMSVAERRKLSSLTEILIILTLAQQFQALLRHQRAKGWKRLECSELFELQMEKKSGMSRYDSSERDRGTVSLSEPCKVVKWWGSSSQRISIYIYTITSIIYLHLYLNLPIYLPIVSSRSSTGLAK